MPDEYLDEKIVELRHAQKKESHQDIYKGSVFVGNEDLMFCEKKLFDEQFSVMLPDSYVEMPFDIAQIKYPSEQRPQFIWTNEHGSVNFCFSMYEMEFKQEQVREAITGFQSILKKVQPAIDFLDLSIIPLGKSQIGWFDYKNYTVDEQLYNMMFVTPINGLVCSGVFNCPDKESDDWKSIMKSVLLSIKDLGRKDR